MDIVHIEALEIDAVIGVFDWERKIRQRLVLDVRLGGDFRQAAATDELQFALDYSAISEELTSLTQALQPKLLETLSEALAEALLRKPGIEGVWLKISKPGAVPAARNVAVEVSRGEAFYGDIFPGASS